MDGTDNRINQFKSFLEQFYEDDLLKLKTLDTNALVVDFYTLIAYSPELGNALLEEPNALKEIEIAAESIESSIKNIRIRIKNLPQSSKILIRDIRAIHIGKMITIDSYIRQKSDVRPIISCIYYECPSCGSSIPMLQLEAAIQEPSKCGCSFKGKFNVRKKILKDCQLLVVEESTDNIPSGEQPRRLNIILVEDLVSPLSDGKTNPGTRVIINGFIKEIPVGKGKIVQTRCEIVMDANYIEPSDSDYSEVELTPAQEAEIIQLSKQPDIFKQLTNSLAPNIYGHEQIKEALLLQLFGGVKKSDKEEGDRRRGDTHILLIGDPGIGKSQLLKRISNVAPKSRYVSGKGVTGAGLTATVVKDEFTNGWSLEAGALVLANKGMCIIDELDKMNDQDRSAMHEALEQQVVHINKANIQATLKSETTVLAAANPKLGRFDPCEPLTKQLDLPPSLVNRFDLVFPLRDLPNADTDKILAEFILNVHKETNKGSISTEILRNYIIFAKNNFNPTLSQESSKLIVEFFVKLRNSNRAGDEMKPIPISSRQLEALIRLTEASARSRLSNVTNKEDSMRAINLVTFCLKSIGMDPDTGEIDIDRVFSETPHSERNKIQVVKKLLQTLTEKIGKEIPIGRIEEAAKEKNISEDELIEILYKLRRSGDILEPRKNILTIV